MVNNLSESRYYRSLYDIERGWIKDAKEHIEQALKYAPQEPKYLEAHSKISELFNKHQKKYAPEQYPYRVYGGGLHEPQLMIMMTSPQYSLQNLSDFIDENIPEHISINVSVKGYNSWRSKPAKINDGSIIFEKGEAYKAVGNTWQGDYYLNFNMKDVLLLYKENFHKNFQKIDFCDFNYARPMGHIEIDGIKHNITHGAYYRVERATGKVYAEVRHDFRIIMLIGDLYINISAKIAPFGNIECSHDMQEDIQKFKKMFNFY